MSEFNVEVVRLGKPEKHPNADALEIFRVMGDYPVIARIGDYKEGDLAVYVPIDAIVPATDKRWDFLSGHLRIKAKKLRGVFSMGLLTTPDPSWKVGQNVQKELAIVKYEPKEKQLTKIKIDNSKPKSWFRKLLDKYGWYNANANPSNLRPYYDLEGLRKYSDILEGEEEVVLLEKIHGTNSAFLFNITKPKGFLQTLVWLYGNMFHKDTQFERFYVFSHNMARPKSDKDLYWQIFAKYKNIGLLLTDHPNLILYGEIYGKGVQDLDYGETEPRFVAFDLYDRRANKWVNYDRFVELCDFYAIPTAPVLYRGPWKMELRGLADGQSIMPKAKHIREGFVVRPVMEKWSDRIGRIIFKLKGEEYMLKGYE